MMFYVNEDAQPNGDHEVHRRTCEFLPGIPNQKYLGDFEDCEPAVEEARNYFDQVNGCFFCARQCHTT